VTRCWWGNLTLPENLTGILINYPHYPWGMKVEINTDSILIIEAASSRCIRCGYDYCGCWRWHLRLD
jgi:hypothetical protein